MWGYNMKTVLVTGGSRGIGKAIVEKFAKENYNVILNYNKSFDSAKAIENNYKNVKIFKADVTNKKEVQNMIEFANQTFGKIDILINNAGIGCTFLVIKQLFEAMINGFTCKKVDQAGFAISYPTKPL